MNARRCSAADSTGSTGRSAAPDDGFSLMETMVGMGIMSIFMAIFTGAVIGMFTAANKVSTINQSASQLNLAFSRLDKQVRYAAAISPEGQSGGNWYVEFLTTNTGTSVCSQLKVDPTTVSCCERTWTVPAAGAATPPVGPSLPTTSPTAARGRPRPTDRSSSSRCTARRSSSS